MTDYVVVDGDKATYSDIVNLSHVHDLSGKCLKNRFGPKCPTVSPELDTLRGVVKAVQVLADKWATEGADLVKNCYSGQDVFEGETQAKCAAALRDALAPVENVGK